MVTFAAGTVVLVRFPFSDLSAVKLRPAVVLADVGRGDYILSQITSKHTPTRDESPRAASVDGPGELAADGSSAADIRLRFMGTPSAAKTHAMNLMETIRAAKTNAMNFMATLRAAETIAIKFRDTI